MKPLSVLLVGLLLAAGFNFGLDVYQQAHLRALLPTFAEVSPFGPGDRTFDERLEATGDPDELRQAALKQHAKHRDTYRLLAALLASVDRTNGIATLRSGTLLVLALGALGFILRDGPSAAKQKRAAEIVPPPR